MTSFETVTATKQNGIICRFPATIEQHCKSRIQDWLQEGFASFNVNTTLNQNNVSGFETKTNGYT
jgi:iron complex outermembrane receptor protein